MQTTDLIRELDGKLAPAAGRWTFDPAHSSLGFEVRHMMVTKVRGSFQRFDGEIQIGERPEDSLLDVTIDAASIQTANDQRDTHLRSADFLDVEKFPALRFRSTAVRQTGDDTLSVEGELTIKDVTRPVTLEVEYHGTQPTPWGGTAAGFSARTSIDREDFGITWNQVLETGGVVVGRKVTIQIDVELVPAVSDPNEH